MTTDLGSRTHALYRFYDVGGILLYVGITADIPTRFKKHSDDKPWWSEVARIAIEPFPDRAAVLAAERRAIGTELPRWNVQHQPKPVLVGPTGPQLKIPCMKCGEPIGAKGAFYLPASEMRRYYESRERKREFETRKKAETGSQLVFWSIREIRDFGERSARWQIHCLPCMAPCYDHPDDPDDSGCGGSYWFDGDQADTWPKIADWTAHLLEKDWLPGTTWSRILHYLVQHNGEK